MPVRQEATTLAGIRDDHKARYRWALQSLQRFRGPGEARILDAGCGVGYGSYMMAAGLHTVVGFDSSPEAIALAEQHYGAPGCTFKVADLATLQPPAYDLVTMFEVLEHTPDAIDFLRRAASTCRYLAGSVPNEQVVPFAAAGTHPDHYRHFTFPELVSVLSEAGWLICSMQGQRGKRGPAADVLDCPPGEARTLVFFCATERAFTGAQA